MSVKILTPMQPVHLVDGVALATFTAFADLTPSQAPVIPLPTLEAGLDIELEAWGEYSSTTGPPTWQIGFWINTVATQLAVCAATAGGTSVTSVPWLARWRGRLRVATPAASGSFNGSGYVMLGVSLGGAMTLVPAPATLAARTVAQSVAAALPIGVGAACGTSNAANTIKCNGFSGVLYSGY